MKKQIAIFAFAVFFLAQFGKVINFVLCKAVVYQQTQSFVCDCEKRLYDMAVTDNSSKEKPPQNIVSQQSSEELFHLSKISSFVINRLLRQTDWPKANAEALYHAFGKSVFHPPVPIA